MENLNKRIYKSEYHKISENASGGLRVVIAFVSLVIIFLSLGVDKFQGLFFLCFMFEWALSAAILYITMVKVILPDGYRILATKRTNRILETNRTILKTEGHHELSGQRIENISLAAKIALYLEKVGFQFD